MELPRRRSALSLNARQSGPTDTFIARCIEGDYQVSVIDSNLSDFRTGLHYVRSCSYCWADSPDFLTLVVDQKSVQPQIY